MTGLDVWALLLAVCLLASPVGVLIAHLLERRERRLYGQGVPRQLPGARVILRGPYRPRKP